MTSYLQFGTSNKDLVNKFGLTVFMIRGFSKDLLERKPIKEAIKRQFGYEGKFGLELAQAEIRAFKAIYNRLPTTVQMSGIRQTIELGKWASYEINTWNDLLMKTCGEINAESRIYTGEQGLERAMGELRAFKATHGRLPGNKDKEMGGIVAAIDRGKWDSNGIKTWNDLLMKTFGEINIEMGKYTGEEGLKRAMAELRNFKNKYYQLPVIRDKGMSGIRNAIRRGEWASYEINTWNDLLMKTFRRLNRNRK